MRQVLGRIAYVAVVGLMVTAACRETTTENTAERGSLRVTVVTQGGDPDLDGYDLIVDYQTQRTIGSNGAVTLLNLAVGTHRVELGGMAINCDLQGAQFRTITVTSPGRSELTLPVQCQATGVMITNTTVGIDYGPPYRVRVDNLSDISLQPDSTTTVSRLSPGTHSVTLTLDPTLTNCQAAQEGPVQVDVPFRTMVPVSFSISCVARYGAIRVSVAATGEFDDWSGFLIQIDGRPPLALTGGTAMVDNLVAGDHVVVLSGVPGNCTLDGSPSRNVAVVTGGLTRQTTQTTFTATCTGVERPIAFTRYPYASPHWGYDSYVTTIDPDGVSPRTLAEGAGPSWSPDGTRLVFVGIPPGCYYGCSPTGLYLINRDGTGRQQLTQSPTDYNPDWSPTGDQIAFERGGWIWLMATDGSSPAPLALPGVSAARNPAWSPDGSRLAFTCMIILNNSHICIVNRDGSGLIQLTSGPYFEYEPAWSPDGTRLAFGTNRYGNSEIALVNADGSGLSRLAVGYQASWSADGQRLVFARDGRLYLINPDGTGLLALTGGVQDGDNEPVWRR